MLHYPTLFYGPDDSKNLIIGDDTNTLANVLAYANAGLEARNLSNTALSNLCTLADTRIPATLADFDATYPGCAFSDEFLNPPG